MVPHQIVVPDRFRVRDLDPELREDSFSGRDRNPVSSEVGAKDIFCPGILELKSIDAVIAFAVTQQQVQSKAHFTQCYRRLLPDFRKRSGTV